MLLVRDTTGSYASAGAVAAAFAIGAALIAPFVGRLVDRLGARPVLVPLAILHACALVTLVALAKTDSPATVLAVISFTGGVTVSPVGSVLRALWPELVGGELLTAAFALDSVSVEAAFVVGPLIVAGAAALDEPGLALLIAAAMVIAGTFAFVSTEPVRRYSPASQERDSTGILGPLSSPGVRTVVISIAPIGFCLGASEVAFPAFGEAIGDQALAGPLIAIWSFGSAAGGLTYGALGHRFTTSSRYVFGAAALPLVTLPLALAGTFAAMVPLALLAGMAIAPFIAAGHQLVGEVAPRGAPTEAFTWLITSLVAGASVGNAASGAMVEAHDWRAAFLMAGAVGILGFLTLLGRRTTLTARLTA